MTTQSTRQIAEHTAGLEVADIPQGKSYNSRPCDLVQVTSTLDNLTHYVRRRELLGLATQQLATFSGFGDPRTWGPAELPREHVIFDDHDDAPVLLQRVYVELDGWYDAAAGNS